MQGRGSHVETETGLELDAVLKRKVQGCPYSFGHVAYWSTEKKKTRNEEIILIMIKEVNKRCHKYKNIWSESVYINEIFPRWSFQVKCRWMMRWKPQVSSHTPFISSAVCVCVCVYCCNLLPCSFESRLIIWADSYLPSLRTVTITKLLIRSASQNNGWWIKTLIE